MNVHDAQRAAARIKVEIPDILFVSSPRDAEFIVSILFTANAVCTHCEVGPETQWVAVIERGGEAHEQEYQGMGTFLTLTGRVSEGASPTRGFVRQLKEMLRPDVSRTAS